jgi:hypothetical protein
MIRASFSEYPVLACLYYNYRKEDVKIDFQDGVLRSKRYDFLRAVFSGIGQGVNR